MEEEKGYDAKMKGESFGIKAAQGVLWISVFRIIQRILDFLRTIILARLLSPKDFGVMGVAVLCINLLETFSSSGIKTALIQKEGDITDYLNTSWTIQAVRGGVLGLILYFTAPYASDFFESPSALSVIKVLAFIPLLNGMKNTGIILFHKEMQFDKQAFFQTVHSITAVVVSISVAFMIKNVWALVAGALSGAIVECILSYVLHPHRPRFSFKILQAKELIRYGKWMFGTSIMTFLITEGDDAFVGKILGVTALGYYQLAYHFSNISATEIGRMISVVMLPVYSKIHGDLFRLGKAYLKVLHSVSFIIFPLTGLILIFGGDFVRIFLSEKWNSIIPALKVLSLAGCIRAISGTTGTVFKSIGKPDIVTKWQPVRLLVLIVSIYPLSKSMGIIGTSFSVLLCNLVSAVGFSIRVIQKTRIQWLIYLRNIAIPSANMCFAIVVAIFLRSILDIKALSLWQFCIGIALFICVYLCMSLINDRQIFRDLSDVVPVLPRVRRR
jgi:O-antigen/teichoic acid export membrane protein